MGRRIVLIVLFLLLVTIPVSAQSAAEEGADYDALLEDSGANDLVGSLPKAVSYTHLDVYKRQEYDGVRLTAQCSGGAHNLIRLLDYLREQELSFGRVYAAPTTLNDVFLEITGKHLRE